MREITLWLISLADTLENKLLLSMLDQLHDLIATAMIEAENKLPE